MGIGQTPIPTRQDVGLGVLVIASYLGVNEANRAIRYALKDSADHVPYWLDHVGLMLTAKLAFWILVGFLLLHPDDVGLRWPRQPRWFIASVASGLGLTIIVGGALALSRNLKLQWAFHPDVVLGNVFSNFYEELINRGIVLALLLRYFRAPMLAFVISALLFCQGHLRYPMPLLSTVFLGGVLWAYMTHRYQSIFPAYVSHMVLDIVGDTLFYV